MTLSTATGYFLGPGGGLNRGLLWPVLGTFVLAGGSACLNHVQDARIDAVMPRTRNRPIPSGKIRSTSAVFVAGLLVLLGFSLLATADHSIFAVLALGGLALLWYNGVYTYLKRVTAFAVVPGALIGAIPPVIGFVAGGGHWANPGILLVAGFFFVWQVPHFWLLSLLYDEQYRKAGLPTPTDHFDRRQQLRLTTSWMLASAGAGMALAAGILDPMGPAAKIALVLGSIWLGYRALALLTSRVDGPIPIRRAFVQINAYLLLVMLCLSLHALLGSPPA